MRKIIGVLRRAYRAAMSGRCALAHRSWWRPVIVSPDMVIYRCDHCGRDWKEERR